MCTFSEQKKCSVLSRLNKISALVGAVDRLSVALLQRCNSEEMKENYKYLLS